MSTEPRPARTPASGAARTRAYRARLRAQGLKPRTLWTYDVNNPGFRARLDADLRRARHDETEQDIMNWIEAIRDESDLWE